MYFTSESEKYQIALYIDAYHINESNSKISFIHSFISNVIYYMYKNNFICCKKDFCIIFNTILLIVDELKSLYAVSDEKTLEFVKVILSLIEKYRDTHLLEIREYDNFKCIILKIKNNTII